MCVCLLITARPGRAWNQTLERQYSAHCYAERGPTNATSVKMSDDKGIYEEAHWREVFKSEVKILRKKQLGVQPAATYAHHDRHISKEVQLKQD